MITMAYKINRTASVHELDETDSRKAIHYTLRDPPPESLRGMIVLDLEQLRRSADANRQTLLAHYEMFLFVEGIVVDNALETDIPFDPDVPLPEFLGRIWAYNRLVIEPRRMKRFVRNLNDIRFLENAGMRAYLTLKPGIDPDVQGRL